MTDLIIQWVRDNRQSDHFFDHEITQDTDLMATGLLDSFGFVDLLLFIESQSGTRVDLTDVDPIEFTNIKGLCNIALSNSNNDQQTIDMTPANDVRQLAGLNPHVSSPSVMCPPMGDRAQDHSKEVTTAALVTRRARSLPT
jgi:acyl carrier protein